jgi:HAE1 family hydrophobic/amphiphilic exporter-1
MRCASFVHSAERKTRIGIFFDSFMEWLEKTYHKTLVWSLNHKLVMVLGTVIFLVVSFWSLKFINKELTPLQDQSIFLARLQTPVGSSFAFTDGKTKLAEEWFRKQPEVLRVYASVGGFSTGVADSNVAMMFVTMIPKDQRKVSQQDFMNRARKELSSIQDLTVRMQDLSARGFSSGRGFPIEFTVLGPNWDKLAVQAQKIMAEMKASGIMTDIDSNYLEGMPEISIVPDRPAAAHHGVSVAAIGKTINALMGGVINGQYERDGKRYDIRVKIEPSQDPLSQLKYLKVANARGNMIPLSQVVTQLDRKSLQSISRMNRQRAISVYANLMPGKSQQEAMDYITKRSTELLEPGYFLDKEGSSKSFKESFQSLIFALILGLVVAYMILAAQFNSFIDPVTILMALPFSIGGALAGLMLTGQSINMYSMIGVLLLMGIVKKNSIMLVEFANQVRERDDLDARTSLLKACPVRLRPILMTSFSTIAGAVPSALAQGAGAETFRPMAITIIGGTLFSTFLTLVVVPAVYLGTDRFRKRDQTLKELKAAFRTVGNEGILE